MPEQRFVRYVLRGNYWISPGRTAIPAPPFVVPPVDPPAATAFVLDDAGSQLNGTRVLV